RAAVNDLLAAPPDRAIPTSSVHPEAFGLDRPALSITYILPDDSQAVLAIGAANPGADARYARFNDAGPVYLVRSLYVTPIENRSAESCLEHRITNIHPADVVSVTIHRGSTLTRLTRRGHHWLIASVPSPATQPSAAASTPAATQTPAQLPAGLDLPADTASVEGRAGILQRLNSIPIAHYLIHPETLPGHPQAVLEIQLRSGQTPGIEALSSVPG